MQYVLSACLGHLENLETEHVICTLQDGILDVSVDSVQQLNRVIDMIRGAGLLIDSVIPVKQSLESYFIDLIRDIREEGGSA